MHSRYKEWCVLASTGQLDPAHEPAFADHLSRCAACREMFRELAALNHRVMPVLAADHAATSDAEVPPDIRRRFLDRLGNSDLSNLAPAPAFSSASNSAPPAAAPVPRTSTSRVLTWTFAPRIIATAAACLIFGLSGYLIARDRFSRAVPLAAVSITHPAAVVASPTPVPIAKPNPELDVEITALRQQLQTSKARNLDLEAKLQAFTSQSETQSSQSQRELQSKIKEIQDSEEQSAKLKAQLAALQQKLSQTDAIQIAQQQTTQDLMAKLSDAQRQLDHERETQVAKSQAAQMISARNLHIVDVRESEPGGKQQRAFGRVFYVEGQSLVFYAYDLPSARKTDRHLVFQVWGETAGVKTASYSLGILHSDVPDQSRWVLTFDDPKILNRINSVYITAAQDGNVRREPSGRKLLFAFLGSPNHP